MLEIIHYMIFAFGVMFVAFVFFWCGVEHAQKKRLKTAEKHRLKKLIVVRIAYLTAFGEVSEDGKAEVRELHLLQQRIDYDL